MSFLSVVIALAVIALGIASATFFLNAGSKLSDSGDDLTYLRSVGGQTVAEAYYQEIGHYGLTYSKLAYGFGWFTLMLSIALGSIIISLRIRVSPSDKSSDIESASVSP